MNNSNLKRVFGLTASFVVLVGCDLSDAPQMRAKIDCINHLKELGLSVATEANDHAGTIPGDFLFLTNQTISPSVLICPIDPTRRGNRVSAPGQLLTPAQLQASNISYQLVSPRAQITSAKSEALVRCPFHQQVSYLDGSEVKSKSEESK